MLLSIRYLFSSVAIFLSVLFFSVVGITQVAWASSSFAVDAGFVPNSFFLSEVKPIDGDTIELKAGIYNNTSGIFSGTIEFHDGVTLLGESDFSVLSGDTKIVEIDWQANAGSHSLSAILIKPSMTSTTGAVTSVYISNTTLAGPSFSVATKIADQSADGSTTDANDIVLNNVNTAEEYILTKIPASIISFVSRALSNTESTRIAWGLWLNADHDLQSQKVDMLNNLPPLQAVSPSVRFVDKPLAYLWLIALAIFAFIVNATLVFYGLAIVIIYFILKHIVVWFIHIIRRFRYRRKK